MLITQDSSAELVRIVDRAHFWFDGTNDHISVPDHTNLDFGLSDDFSIGWAGRSYAWDNGFQVLFNKQNGTSGNLELSVSSAAVGRPRLNMWHSSNGDWSDTAAVAPSGGAAISAVGVRNTTDDDLELFVDGTGTGTPAADGSTTSYANSAAAQIGGNTTHGRYFKGEIWAASAHRVALSDADVAALDAELNAVYTASAADAHMAGAEFWVDAAHYSDGSGVVNDRSGNGHTSSAMPNALFYDWNSTDGNYYRNPEIAGAQHLSTPDATKFDITDDGDLDFRWLGSLDDWTSTKYPKFGKKDDPGNNNGWEVDMDNSGDGKIRAIIGRSGVTYIAKSSVATGFADGTKQGIRATYDASAGSWNYYTMDDPDDAAGVETTAWTLLGTADVSSGTTFSTTNAEHVYMGGTGAFAHEGMKVYEMAIHDGIAGTRVAYFKANDWTDLTTAYTDADLNVWTAHRSGTAELARIVTRPHWWLDTNAKIDFPDASWHEFSSSAGFTLGVGGRVYSGNAGTLIGKVDNNDAYYLGVASSNANFWINDGAPANSTSDSTPITVGGADSFIGVRDVAADDIEVFSSGTGSATPTIDKTTGPLETPFVLAIGAQWYWGYLQGEVFQAALFRSAKSDAEVAEIDTVLNGTYSTFEGPGVGAREFSVDGYVTAANELEVVLTDHSDDGETTFTSVAVPGLTAGNASDFAFKVGWSGTGGVSFFYADVSGDPADTAPTYTALGTTVSTGIEPVSLSKTQLRVGSDSGGLSDLDGRLYWARFRDEAGSVFADPTFTDGTEWPDTAPHADSQANTWTPTPGVTIGETTPIAQFVDSEGVDGLVETAGVGFDPGIAADFAVEFAGRPSGGVRESLFSMIDQNMGAAVTYDTGWQGYTASSSFVLSTSNAADDAAVVIAVQTFQTDWPDEIPGWTRLIGGGGPGAATLYYRLFDGPVSDTTINWGAARQWYIAWSSWTGVGSIDAVNNLQASNDPPGTTASRALTAADKWVAAGTAQCTNPHGPWAYTNRNGGTGAGDCARISEKPGSGSATENPGYMISSYSQWDARMATTLALLSEPAEFSVDGYVTAANKLEVVLTDHSDGDATTTFTSVVVPGLGAGNTSDYAFKVGWSGTGGVSFFYADVSGDPADTAPTYSPLGDPILPNIEPVTLTKTQLRVGSDSDGLNDLDGRLYWARFANGTNGAGDVFADPTFTDGTEWPDTAPHADSQTNTWTPTPGVTILIETPPVDAVVYLGDVEIDPDGTARTYYGFGGDTIIRTTVGTQTSLSVVLADHLGSPSVAFDPTGAGTVTGTRLHEPYGQVRHATGVFSGDRGFTGQQSDPSGLSYYGARYYSPTLMRFISADTIVPDPSAIADLNRYAYVRGNPVRLTDPSGHAACIAGTYRCTSVGRKPVQRIPGNINGVRGRWIGDPSSDSIVIMVPGTGNNGDNMTMNQLRNGLSLWQEMNKRSGGATNAVFMCLCGDPPSHLEALTPGRAQGSSGSLVAQIESLLLHSARVTTISHSYGSTTTGYALRDHGLGKVVDASIHIGSAGVPEFDPAAIGLGPGAFWVGHARNDPVADYHPHGAPPERLVGALILDVGAAEGHSGYYINAVARRSMALIATGSHAEIAYLAALERLYSPYDK